jgi:nucleoside-diphosphate-sugar epimerase
MPLAGRRVAVVGGTGFIGSHLAERLVADGADVLAVARGTGRLSQLTAIRGECVIGLADICDPDAITRMFRRFRPEVVFHLAAHPDASESFGQAAACMRINGLGLVNTLHAAAAAGAEVFVYGASAKDYGNAAVPYRAALPANPICSYAIVKTAGWQLCQLASSFSPLKTVALRPTFVYGPRQTYNVITYARDCVTAGHPIRLQGGSQTRDPLYIDDAVDAFVSVAAAPRAWGHAVPIGGGQEITVRALCEAVVGVLHADVPVVADAQQPRATEIWRSNSDNADARRLFDWTPRTTLAAGLARLAESWQGSRPAAPRAVVITERASCFLHAPTPGLVYRVLDRRDGADRRSAPRGGRRETDFVPIGARAIAHGIGEMV